MRFLKSDILRSAAVLALAAMLLAGQGEATPLTFGSFSMEGNGSAAVVGGVLRLTPGTGGLGSAFVSPAFVITGNTSFSTAFRFRIHDGVGVNSGTKGGDGFVFILQNDPRGKTALGQGGGNIGYGDNPNNSIQITSSLGIEFDTVGNGAFGNDPTSNPQDNHVGININGNIQSIATAVVGPDLNSGNPLFVWVDYDGPTDQLDVYLNTVNTKPASAVLSRTVDLFALAGNQAYFGFSASTGSFKNIHDIEAWSLQVSTDVVCDVKPGSDPNSINPNSKGVIPVAILTTPDFDATTVDPLTVKFGPGEATEAHGKGHLEDVDGDGDTDLVLHFRTQDSGIQAGDTEVTLTGETTGGAVFTCTDAIQTVGGKASKPVAIGNDPNPFNPSTTIRYALPEASNVTLTVYNTLGQRVRTLVSGAQGPGVHSVVWDGRDQAGRVVATGVYIYRLQAGANVAVRKMMLTK